MKSILFNEETGYIRSEFPISCDGPIKIPLWLVDNLLNLSFTHWTPIQTKLVPMILNCDNTVDQQDVIVNSPTGSGKTISYLVPIISLLSRRIVPGIRALIIAPTRDLAIQLQKIAMKLTKGSDLKIALLVGGNSSKFSDEQRSISYGGGDFLACPDSCFQPVDVVVCTPGRLVDHLNMTPGFQLSNLEFLVLDEVDRILEDAQFQDWIDSVLFSISSTKYQWSPSTELLDLFSKLESSIEDKDIGVCKVNHRGTVRKLLFSATITKNPLKLSRLKLVDPLIVSLTLTNRNTKELRDISLLSSDLQALENVPKYQIPTSLSEFMSIVMMEHKPIHLLDLLQKNGDSKTLVFTKSVVATDRLFRLLKEMDATLSIDYLSSSRDNNERKKTLSSIDKGTIRVLVCSDNLARGMDISDIGLVINYDTPVHPRTYIHRVGRTARAGRSGFAHTLLVPAEARFFKENMKKICRVQGKKVEQVALERPSEDARGFLQQAIDSLSAKTILE